MKKLLCLFLLIFLLHMAQAQNYPPPLNVTLKWAPTGLILGSLSLQGEYSFGKQSLTARIGIPINAHHTFQYDGNDTEFNMKATSFLAGYRVYLSKKQLKGLYFEPFFKYMHHTSEGSGSGKLTSRNANWTFTNEYNGGGVGVQLGSQFLVGKRFIIDLFFLGPEINSASNQFNAVERSPSGTWTNAEARDAEKKIKDFIDKFPFLENNTTIMVDPSNRRVSARFKGAIPGFRIGVAFGVAL